jgi:hypothetical protein
MREKSYVIALLVLLLAVVPLAAVAQSDPAPEGVERGGYNIQQSIEFGYRFTDITTPQANGGDDPAMFNTFINLHQGPRLLEQTLSMRSIANTGVLFDNLYISSFGWGGDPNNVARVRVSKNKWYNFNGSFRRDQNFFDYNLLGNPMNNPLTSGILALPVNFSPHSFAVTRRMADTNLTLLPQSKFSVRMGYSRNRANGPSLITNHEAGDTLMVQPWNTTYQTWNVGFDMKFIPKTNISFDQFLQYGKNDTDQFLDPSTGLGSFATYPFANPVSVGNFSAVEFGLIPSSTCVAANGYAVVTNCSGYMNYTRLQRIRTKTPTSQLSIQSRPSDKLEFTGRFSYSSMDMTNAYSEVFNGLVTRTREKSWTITGPQKSQIITGSGDFGVTIHLTDKLSLSNTFRFLNERAPSTSDFTESILAINPKTGTNPRYAFSDCINPATGALILGSLPGQCAWTTDGELLGSYLNQNYKYDTTELEYRFSKAVGARIGYRLGTKVIGYLTERGLENWDITEHTGLFGLWLRPSTKFHANAELELVSNDGVDTRIVPRQQQHYRFRASYTPVRTFTLSGTANLLESRNNATEINFKGHNRNLGFTASYNPNSKFGFDASYNYGNYVQNAWMCFVDNPTTGFTLPAGTGTCPTNGYLFSTADFAWSGANPTTNKYIYSTFEDINHYGSFTVRFQPVKRVTMNLGYGITKVDGSTQQLTQAVPLGPLNYTFHQPLAALSIELAKGWAFNTYYNYDQYNEGSFTGPTAPRYFHDNRTTLAMRYSF